MTTTTQHKLLALADIMSDSIGTSGCDVRRWADNLRALAATLPPDHSVDANKMVATDNGQGLRDVVGMYLRDLRADCEPRPDGKAYGVNALAVRMWIEEFEEALATHPPQQERAALPSAWMRRWAFDGIDVMSFPKGQRPRGWQMMKVTTTKCFEDDVPLLAAPAAPATPESAEPGHGLNAEQVAALLSASLKPEEIGGDAIKQHERVGELLHWFARLTRGMANPKWTTSHACELAYYIATGAMNRHVSVEPARRAAFLEGCNITPAERGMLERLGAIHPTPAASDGGLREASK